jgi:hypothetical protein
MGFQPGISIAKRQDMSGYFCDPAACPENYSYVPEQEISPVFSPVIGLNYYFQKWFHLFFETRYIQGKYISEGWVIPLSELRFSFGLGWNINTVRKK